MFLALAVVPTMLFAQERTVQAMPMSAAQLRSTEAQRSQTIVVTAERPSLLIGAILPELQLGPEDIAAYGANSIGQLLGELNSQNVALGGTGAPLILLNGEQIADRIEIEGLPPEAILRIDLFPEEAALRFGRPGNQRVINIIIRSNFQAITANSFYNIATDGGVSEVGVEANVARTLPNYRWNVTGKASHSDSLVEAERNIQSGFGQFRTIQPAKEEFELGGSYSRAFEGAEATVTARFTRTYDRERVGISTAPSMTLRSNSRSQSFVASALVDGELGRWNWSLSANTGMVTARTLTEIPQASSTSQLTNSTLSEDSYVSSELLFYGTIANLPSGPISLSFLLRGEGEIVDTRSEFNRVTNAFELGRKSAQGRVSLEVPVINRGIGSLGAIGDLSFNAAGELTTLSTFQPLESWEVGGRWALFRSLAFTSSLSQTQSAPDIQTVGSPRLIIPNVPLFDFGNGQSITVEQISGGNPELLPSERRQLRLSASLRPIPTEDLALTASYLRSRTRNMIGNLATSTSDFQAAFPERFIRDASGNLRTVDTRPLNLMRADREEFQWGISFLKRLQSETGGGRAVDSAVGEASFEVSEIGFDLRRLPGSQPSPPRNLQFTLSHTVHLTDRVMIRSGLPFVDFLNGSPLGPRGGRSRHEIEAQISYYASGIGTRLSATWQSGSTIFASSLRNSPTRLTYSSNFDVDVRIFADFEHQPDVLRRLPWLANTRLSFEINNLFNDRLNVENENGNTPHALQSAFLDPVGPTVQISLRKQF